MHHQKIISIQQKKGNKKGKGREREDEGEGEGEVEEEEDREGVGEHTFSSEALRPTPGHPKSFSMVAILRTSPRVRGLLLFTKRALVCANNASYLVKEIGNIKITPPNRINKIPKISSIGLK